MFGTMFVDQTLFIASSDWNQLHFFLIHSSTVYEFLCHTSCASHSIYGDYGIVRSSSKESIPSYCTQSCHTIMKPNAQDMVHLPFTDMVDCQLKTDN